VRFILCGFGALVSTVVGVSFCILAIPDEWASFVAACALMIAVAIFWGRAAAKLPAELREIRPARLERGETYVLQLEQPITDFERDKILRAASQVEDRIGCKFLILDRGLRLVTGEIGGQHD
jgi:hypothetical protein